MDIQIWFNYLLHLVNGRLNILKASKSADLSNPRGRFFSNFECFSESPNFNGILRINDLTKSVCPPLFLQPCMLSHGDFHCYWFNLISIKKTNLYVKSQVLTKKSIYFN